MAAQRCSVCAISYPLGYVTCQVCDGPLDRFPYTEIDDDWQQKVSRALADHPVATENDRVTIWRLDQLLRLGYGVETAESLATDPTVEINRLRVLVERDHVPLDLAARIA